MGSTYSTSSQNPTNSKPETVADYALQKISFKSPSGKRLNFSQESQKIEDTSIKALKKMQDMDEAITKKYNLTAENFDTVWDNFMKSYGHLLQALEIQSFDEERQKIAAAFSEKSFESKEEAVKAYETAVTEELNKITEKTAKQIKSAKKQAEGKDKK